MGPQDVRPAIVIAHAPFDAKRRANLIEIQRALGGWPTSRAPTAGFSAHYLAIQRARVPAMVDRAEDAAVFRALAENDKLLSDRKPSGSRRPSLSRRGRWRRKP
jgi:hypothetical protein